MIPSSLIPDLRALRPERPAEEVFLYARLIWRFTADHVRELEVHDSDDDTMHPVRDIVDIDRCLRQLANAARRAESLQPNKNADWEVVLPVPIVDSGAAGSPLKCGSRYHNPSRAYCLECIPAGAPLSVLLVGARLPTEHEVAYGQEIARSLTAESGEPAGGIVVSGEGGRPPQPYATCPNCLHAAHAGAVCGHSLGETARCLCEAA
jgi:hypothetical protein